jgi:Family of unknown function (DUF5947)
MTTGALGVLQRIRAGSPPPPRAQGEVCELCGEPMPSEHGHLVDLEHRSLSCACRGCYLLFTADGAGGQRFRAVPDRYQALPDIRLTPAQWDTLQIPVSVAFFFVNSGLDRVAVFYPSPAGATESLLPLDAWADVVAAHPELSTLRPDVEAVLVRMEPAADGGECYVVPIDACYELVGRLRLLWKGFDGGAAVHDALDAFFDRIRARAEVGR